MKRLPQNLFQFPVRVSLILLLLHSAGISVCPRFCVQVKDGKEKKGMH